MSVLQKKITFFIGIMCLGIFSTHAQNFSSKFDPNFPVFGFDLLGYSSKPTAKALFQSNNFINQSDDEGLRAVVEKSSTDRGIFSVQILLSKGKTRVMRIQVSVQSDDFTEQNHLTYLNFVNLSNGQSQEVRYNGSQNSLGRVLGAFSQFIDLLYDKSKLFSK
jgi:hypothetical protein